MRKLILLLIPLAAACTLEERGAPEPDATAEVVVGNPDQSDSVEVIISMPTFASVGDEVLIGVLLRNNTDRRLDLHLNGRQTNFDIVITRPDSAVVWQRLGNASAPQILQLRPLGPGETLTLDDRWRAEVAGEYLVNAEVLTDARPFRADPVRLIVR
jgi:hypothetical protein